MDQPHESVCNLDPPNPAEAPAATVNVEDDVAVDRPLHCDLDLNLDEYALAIQIVQVDRILRGCESSEEKPKEHEAAILEGFQGVAETLTKRIDAVVGRRASSKSRSRSKAKTARKSSATAKVADKHEETSNDD